MLISLRWLTVVALALATGGADAVPVDFDGNPITCTDPAGATVPTPCAMTTIARPDGYALSGYSFLFIIPPPPPLPPPPPFPMIAANDSMRAFMNPMMQNLFLHIFGNTKVDVDGAPVLFFVIGTLDGNAIASFSQMVSGHDNHVGWDVVGVAPNVAAGGHILDMHFGIIQLVPGQQSLVNVASLYQVTVDAPEPATLFLVLVALGLTGLARSGGGTPWVPLRASALR